MRKRIEQAMRHQGVKTSDFDLADHRAGQVLKPAAVLVGILDDRLVLTKRSAQLRHHSGQIAFPGGVKDPEDNTLVHTALREANEEIGLDPKLADIIGILPTHETLTGYVITPVLAHISTPFDPVIAPDEVAEMFTIPFHHVANLQNYNTETIYWRGQIRTYLSIPYGPYYTWGATARILRGLAERL